MSQIYQPGLLHSTAPHFDAWGPFRPNDLDACYPMPDWVAARLRDYPQASQGGALRDPLPVPFTDGEVRDALGDVWRHSHKSQDRACGSIDAASVQIARRVAAVLAGRNGGWIDFGGGAYDPAFHSPTSSGNAVRLTCVLYRLVGKPLGIYNTCQGSPPRPDRVYRIGNVRTTFAGETATPADLPPVIDAPWWWSLLPVPLDAPGGNRSLPMPAKTLLAGPGGFFGLALEDEVVPEPVPEPIGHQLFEILEVFDVKGDL